MKEEEKITIKPGFCSVNTYFDGNHTHLPTLIVDRNEWDWVETNYIKDGRSWFAKTIGMTHIYKRRSKNVFYRFDNNLIELKDCPNGRFIYIDSSGNHALGFKGVEYSITGSKPCTEFLRQSFPDLADDTFDIEGQFISLRLFELVYPLRDDDEYPGYTHASAANTPSEDQRGTSIRINGIDVTPEEPPRFSNVTYSDSQSKLYSFNNDGMLVVHHPLEQKPKRKYTKNKLHKRKKHTKKKKD